MQIPIFPLNGAVLFPGTSLPLNIFENRYIEMVNYSLARDRLIGMIQTNENTELYKIGCIGRIHSFSETGDGRYLISLQGVNCFKVLKELNTDQKFRLIEAELLNENLKNKQSLSEVQKGMLLDKYRKYVKFKNINLDLSDIENIETEQVIKFIAMVSPFKNIDKQALLQSLDLNEFYNKLTSIIDLELAGDNESITLN